MKNNIKAMAYVGMGFTGVLFSLTAIIAMYFSTTFLPVYIGKVYVIGNQLTRYALYAMLIVITALSAKLADYGISFFIKKIRKIKRR